MPLALLISSGTVIPTVIVASIWYITLAATATPLEWCLAILLVLWIGGISLMGCTLTFYLADARLRQRSAQKFLRSSDFEHRLADMTIHQLSTMAQVLEVQKTRTILHKHAHESSSDARKRLITLLRAQKEFFEHTEENN